jgi:starvation-inducible DNA-binding protein
MYKSPSPLPEATRTQIARTLDERLADGLDLHSHLKVAHWNVRGPNFPALHALFEQFATQISVHNDAIAERSVTLGGVAHGTTRQVAKSSRLPEYPSDVVRDLDHARAVAERIEVYLTGARESRSIGEKLGDTDTVDLMTGVITELEKNAWFLRATLA